MSFKINLAQIPEEPRRVVRKHLGYMILQLFNRGITYAQIGTWLGVSKQRVKQLDEEMNGK